MRKLMLLAAMLAMVLVAAAPAFVPATAIQVDNDDDDFGLFDNDVFDDFDGDDLDFSVGTNEVDLGGVSQINTGDVSAASVDGDADASIEQELGIGVTQVNTGFDDLDGDGVLDDVDLVILAR